MTQSIGPPSENGTSSWDEALSDSQVDLDELQQAALDIPDSEPLGEADDTNAQLTTAQSSSAAPIQQDVGRFQGSGPHGEFELQDWLRISNDSLGLASTATSAGFNVAKGVTGFSLFLAKRVTQLAVALPALIVDSASGAVPGSEQATFSALAHSSVGGFFDLISTLAVGGIDLGSALTSAGLGAASSGVEGIRRSLGSEVVKSLGQFVKLVQREWNAQGDDLPPGGIPGFGLTGVTRAIIVWICIQMVTQESYERKMLKELEEIDIVELRKQIEREQQQRHQQEGTDEPSAAARFSDVRITSSSEMSRDRGDVIGAEVGSSDGAPAVAAVSEDDTARPLSDKEALQGLLRYSSVVLAVYGGTALAWLGALPKENAEAARVARTQGSLPEASVTRPTSGRLDPGAPLPADGLTREQDEEQFLMAAAMMDLTESEREEQEQKFAKGAPRPKLNLAGSQVIFSAEDGDSSTQTLTNGAAPGTPSGSGTLVNPATTSANAEMAEGDRTGGGGASSYSYLDLLSGRHDEELFHKMSDVDPQHVRAGSYIRSADAPPEPPRDPSAIARPSQPRYYILTDHKAQKIVLVLRGSLTLGDIAADLTCESREFHFPDPSVWPPGKPRSAQPVQSAGVPFPASEASTSVQTSDDSQDIRPLVHEGMYETALAVGSPHAPVHRAVRLAMEASPSYSLDIAGHSLGGGVASILAILWANPATCLTTAASGLPPGRKLHAYCYACPATMSVELGASCEALITTYAYSYDLVCRLSLGSVLDIRNAAAWILWEDRQEQNRSSHNGPSSGFDPSNRSTPLRVPALIKRAFEHQSGRLDPEPGTAIEDDVKAQTEQDFLALRTTLEANMRNVELYPPGQILYLFKDGELLQSHFEQPGVPPVGGATTATTATTAATNSAVTKQQKAFVLRRRQQASGASTTVGKRENVFGQIIFSRRLLSSHMPQHYDLSLRGLE